MFKVTTERYKGYYLTPKMTTHGPKQHDKPFLFEGQKKPRPKAAAGAVKEVPQTGLYLLVYLKH